MARKYWGLRESPFREALDWRRFYSSPMHEEALARLEFLVADRRRLGLLLGAPGCGKSLVLEVFARRLRREGAQCSTRDSLQRRFCIEAFGRFHAAENAPLVRRIHPALAGDQSRCRPIHVDRDCFVWLRGRSAGRKVLVAPPLDLREAGNIWEP